MMLVIIHIIGIITTLIVSVAVRHDTCFYVCRGTGLLISDPSNSLFFLQAPCLLFLVVMALVDLSAKQWLSVSL